MNRFVRIKRYSLTVLAALPAALFWTVDFIACSIKAAFCILLVLLVPAPMSMASLVGTMRAKSSSSTTGNSATSTSISGGSSTDSTASATAERQSLTRTTQTIAAVRAAQAAARAAANASASSVPNGLTSGGLVVASGVSSNSSLWQNANLPTQTVANGETTVTVKQTSSKAILTWDSFNVGKETTLDFDQQGNSSWVALNRLSDASASPSQILGSIKADGSVYIINRNGIIFGGASQVNVHSFIAAAANITNDQFLNNGIYSTLSSSTYTPVFTDAAGKVIVEAGAQITTPAPSSVTSGGGFVLLLGSEVDNYGTITTPNGQTQLAAGDDFVLRYGYSTSSNSYSTTCGNEIAPLFDANSIAGSVTNTGLITASEGDITLAGRTILQDGVLIASTSVSQRGTIHLLNSASDTSGSITFSADSVTAILPELDSTETALDSQRDTLVAASGANSAATGQFDNLSVLSDRKDQSRIEIVTGGDVVFQDSSTALAQGGQIATSAAGRITAESGATLDVSGVSNVTLAMSANNIMVNVQGNELRDSPLNRDSDVLKNTDVWINISDLTYVPAGTGDYTSDRYYTAGGLLEVSGYLSNIGHTIGEWASVGGSITLSANEVVAQAGSTFDISGGSVHYDSGTLKSTRLLGSDGNYYSIEDAPSTLTFTIANNAFIVDHEKWGIQESYSSPLSDRSTIYTKVDGYTIGKDAGSLILSTPTAIFEGTIKADVVNGATQTNARSSDITDGYKVPSNTRAQAGSLVLGRYDFKVGNNAPYAVDVKIGDVADITGNLGTGDALPEDRTGTAWFNATRLNEAGLGGLTLETTGSITIESDLTLSPGGALVMIAPTIDIAANITARSGSISATNWFESHTTDVTAALLDADGGSLITLREDVTLDLRGLWVNTALNADDASQLGLINGGEVYLATTHDLTLKEGSLIDVSSGAASLPDGKTSGGTGGNVTLIADLEVTDVKADGLLTLDGKIAGFGVDGGGTLKIESGTAISIGGKLLETDGVLPAGETSLAELVLLEDYEIKVGETLLLDYNYTVNISMPGEAMPPTGLKTNTKFTTAANWTPVTPEPTAWESYRLYVESGNFTYEGKTYKGGYIYIYSEYYASVMGSSGGLIRVQNAATGAYEFINYIPAGVTLNLKTSSGTDSASAYYANYVVPADVFPNGLPTYDQTRTLAAGNPSPVDMTVPAGTHIPAGFTNDSAVLVQSNLELSTDLFQTGFSNYDITARNGVVVVEGAKLEVEVPVYRLTTTSASTATGADLASVLELWTPPLYQEDPVNGVLTQREGASLTLRSSRFSASSTSAVTSGGPLVVAEGASITVDPGESISLLGFDMTIEGSLIAPSGTITLNLPEGFDQNFYGNTDPSLIWIGDHAILDVAARPALAVNQYGSYGWISDGGTIAIGGDLDWEETGEAYALDAFVVIRPGALLDASGASGTLYTASDSGLNKKSTPVEVASDGGSIIIKSNNGLYLEGTLRAEAGGKGAAGGTLALALEAPLYYTSTTNGGILNPREFILTQTQGESLLSEGVTAQTVESELASGTARYSVEQIQAGGFGNLSLLVNGLLSFDGNISLNMSQSLQLYAGSYALSENAASDSTVSLSAPYVRLAGVTRYARDYYTMPSVDWTDGISQQLTEALFKVYADLIDIRDTVGFGARGTNNATGLKVDRRGFATVDLTSTGDLRLLSGIWRSNETSSRQTKLETPGDIILTAAQIYPTTQAKARIVAGYQGDYEDFAAGTSLTIHRYGDGEVAMPYSAFGQLTLAAETINQGGIVRAPFGILNLGNLTSSVESDSVNLLAGSITSVSGAGLTMPYGGTVDDVTYTYDGQELALSDNTLSWGEIGGTILIQAAHVTSENGSILDLSGGGELTGAGFVSGRGGSVDVLTTAFANSNPGYTYSSSGNAVYAIVPSSSASYAPVAGEAGYGDPLIGQQITIPEGVPGLPAGTYTLMPSTYALAPGAYRVEIGAGNQTALKGVSAVGNGSYIAAGTLSIANTGISEALPNLVIITPADTVRTHSSYNETDYNAFVVADAESIGVPRTTITADAGYLSINLSKSSVADDIREALVIDGTVLLTREADSDGYGGTVSVTGISEVLADGQSATSGLSGASVHADALSAFDAPRLLLNADISVNYGQTGYYATITGSGDLIVRSGAEITAGEIIIGSSTNYDSESGSYIDGAITIEQGASLIARASDSRAFDSSDGYVFQTSGALILSGGWVNLLLTDTDSENGAGININIGARVTAAGDLTTTLISDGTIAIATSRALTIADNVSYGTKNLVLGVSSVNLGEDSTIAAASAAGQLPDGLVLNQAKLAALLAGNTATNAPALETLVLNAKDAVNVYGAVELDATSVERIVFGTPAIYGYGAAGDVATIRADEFIWTGAEGEAGAPVASLLGNGTLAIEATSILFGYGPNTQPASIAKDERLALGFANVSLNASGRISASGESTLSVYQSRGDYVSGEGWQYTGGNLSISTPLVTGEAGSKFTVTAGGDVVLSAPGSVADTADVAELGAQLAISARNVTLNTAVALPSGVLTLTAEQNLTLGEAAHIDLAGRSVALIDVTNYSWGGDLVLVSTNGNITTAEDSLVDLSAKHNSGGTMTVTALGAAAGQVDLAGAILGSATGDYETGGSTVPYDAAELTVRAQTLADFAGLNARLNEGGVFGARRFQIKQGDLTIGDEVKAREVQIVLDGGNLTVNGTIDASGVQVGSITLAASGDLTINGILDAHGTGLRVDSYGEIIDSPNRAIVDLTSSHGTLTLGAGAVIDLRTGTEVAVGTEDGQYDGVARGTLDLNAARIGSDDVAIEVTGTPVIRGAKTIAVNAFRTYDDAPLADTADVSGARPQLITQAYLDTIDIDSQAFINAALLNTGLSGRLARLGTYHLRPGVEIISNDATNPTGTLTVAGDLDLSGYRYGPEADRTNPAMRGYGEPGVLVLRAAGDLNIYGSITDGFAPPAETPDDSGWILTEGTTPFGGDIVIPMDGVVLDAGTTFVAGVTLNYSVPLTAMTLASGTVLPVDAVLTSSYSLSSGTVLAANIYNADGSIAYAVGTVLAQAVTLNAGMKLGAGTTLNAATGVAALTWPKGIALPSTSNVNTPLVTSAQVSLARGSLIPSMTNVQLVGDTAVDLRSTVDGRQGANWAVASMLGAGASSWSIDLVAGADLTSADVLALNPASKGTIRLADTHYVYGYEIEVEEGTGTYVWSENNDWGMTPGEVIDPYDLEYLLDPDYNYLYKYLYEIVGGVETLVKTDPVSPSFSVVRTGVGDLSLVAAGDIRMESLYGVYTAGTATSVEAAYNQARGTLTDGSVLGNTDADYSAAMASYEAWYPDQGGNLLIVAGGDLVGDILENGWSTDAYEDVSSVVTGTWLWRQGSGSVDLDDTILTSWWINFGTYIRVSSTSDPIVTGFTGYGTLGGGNVTVRVGGDAGEITSRGTESSGLNKTSRSQGLVIAVASTGRVDADGTLVQTGGGDLDLSIAGALNPLSTSTDRNNKTALGGSIINLRGTTQIDAASIGTVNTSYRIGTTNNPVDPRGTDPFEENSATSYSGIVLVPGDSAVYVQTLGDMVIAGAGDATRSLQYNTSSFTVDGATSTGGGYSWFTLWTENTAINLISAGGNMAPSKAGSSSYNGSAYSSDVIDDVWPSILRVAAYSGSIYFGVSAGYTSQYQTPTSDVLAPSATSELSIIAAGSIYGGARLTDTVDESRHSITLSSSGTELPTPFDPAFVGVSRTGGDEVSNLSIEGEAAVTYNGGRSFSWNGEYSLFAFGLNTAATALERDADAEPIRIYAVEGDIVGLSTGHTIEGSITAYVAGAPVWMQAGRDIVSSGSADDANLIVHSNETDVSIISAGRDILYSNFDIAGPGTLEISAGRNIQMGDNTSVTSIGPIVAGDNRSGASITMMAGMGDGADWSAIRTRYLSVNLDDEAEVTTKVYTEELSEWLADRYSFTGTDEGALAYFDALAPEQQRIFLRQVYFAELKAAGREYNDPTSSRYHSYLRGREAIAALFPENREYSGSVTMYGNSGISTLFGGDITILTPGGRQVIGVEGTRPGSTAGLITQGSGDINLYSESSILLGLSRIMTTFGGNIMAWSAEGDINAGRGSKTTVIYTPPKRVYDNYGNVTLSPTVPSSGAGIATLNPIPEVPPGDIDLIAPLGTIDAGEAGIRVSGNINIAALYILNAANIQVQGNSSGIPTVTAVSPNIGAMTAAANTSGAATNAMNAPDTGNGAAQQALPSIFQVQVVGYGMKGDTGDTNPGDGTTQVPGNDTEVIFAKLNQ
ncbi:MAG: filamentous hemagglutinin family protein [Chthoniobacteraceae bacterium]